MNGDGVVDDADLVQARTAEQLGEGRGGERVEDVRVFKNEDVSDITESKTSASG